MRGIFDKDIESRLTHFNALLSANYSWEQMTQIFSQISDSRARSHADSGTYLSQHLSIANFVTAGIHSVSLSLFNLKHFEPTASSNDQSENVFPQDWLSESLRPIPDFILLQLFCQLSNLSTSLVHMVEIGQDSSARVLLRAIEELFQIILIISADKNDFKRYSIKGSNSDSEIMHKYFSTKKRQTKLAAIEKRLGFEENQIEERAGFRTALHKNFSGSVHSSPISSVVGSMVWSFDKDLGHIGLVGGCNKLSRSTLGHFIASSDLFLEMFIQILEKINKFKFPEDRTKLWNNTKATSLILRSLLEAEKKAQQSRTPESP